MRQDFLRMINIIFDHEYHLFPFKILAVKTIGFPKQALHAITPDGISDLPADQKSHPGGAGWINKNIKNARRNSLSLPHHYRDFAFFL